MGAFPRPFAERTKQDFAEVLRCVSQARGALAVARKGGVPLLGELVDAPLLAAAAAAGGRSERE